MSTTAKYAILSSGEVNHIDLGFNFPDLSLSGQRIEYIGSSAIDTVFLRPGVEIDFSSSGGGQDKIYFEGSWDDYKNSLSFPSGENGLSLTLEREVNGEIEKAVFRRGFISAISDLLVFSDGVIDAWTMWNDKAAAVPDDTLETSVNPALPDKISAVAKMASFSSDGIIFPAVESGMFQEVIGGAGVDTVYLGEGATLQALSLGSGKDIIYLPGNFSDYSKDVNAFGRITLTRDHDNNPDTEDEIAIVSAGFGGNDDMLVFADGAATSTRLLRGALAANTVPDPDAVTTDELGAIWDSETRTPGLVDAPVVVAFGALTADGDYRTGDEIVITATMSEAVTQGSTFEITLDTGAVVVLTAGEEGTVLTGRYTIGADDASADLTVASYAAGAVFDLDGAAMTSTALPPASSNIAANHAIAVNQPADLTLESVMAGVGNLDVRSDIVLSAVGGAGIALTTVADEYEIRLEEQAGAGFKDDMSDGSQTITVTVDEQGNATIEGGTISFVDGKAVIDFDHDFDLSNSFIVEADAGLFVDETTGAGSLAVGGNDVAFDTVAPDADGVAAQIWDGVSLRNGDIWYDGVQGDHLATDTGLEVNLADIAGVVVIGQDVDDGASIELKNAARVELSGFGADDRLYVDHRVGAAVNDVNEETVAISQVVGGGETILLFSGMETVVAAFITFTDDLNVSGMEGNELVATAFFRDSIPQGATDLSFEQILKLEDGQTPVISG